MNEPCPKCREKGKDTRGDNLHRYPDGHGYCFACGYLDSAGAWKIDIVETNDKEDLKMPPDTTNTIGMEALNWLSMYDITKEEVVKYRMKWSPRQKWLIFPISSTMGWDVKNEDVDAWQARVFNSTWKARYYNVGPFDDIFWINNLQNGKGDSVVVVEDMLSAIKLGRHYSAMPLFGSHLNREKLTDMKYLCEKIVFWLDEDKIEKAMMQAKTATQYGFECKLICTKHDPKEYSDNFIAQTLDPLV